MGKYKINGIQTKKKNNLKFMVLVIFLISLIMCISSFGIATWARYRTNTSGGVEAQIAKWSFKVNGEETQFADINLADTIDFTHVATDKIAPGTNGSFDLVIDGSGSEVSIDYYINVNAAGKPTNLKFYTDAQYSNEISIVNNKFSIEDEILLLNINTPVTKTIYWKWDYRTSSMPSQEILNNYVQDINGLQTLINEYNEVGKTAEQKNEIASKINDKIDTYEEGGEVVLGVSVVGIQKHPEGFVVKSVYITSSTDEEYVEGDEVNLTVEFTEGVYADNHKGIITEQTAPELTIEFQENANELNGALAKIASTKSSIMSIAEANNYKVATFVSATVNKLNYKYIIESGDVGDLKIFGMSGTVYNKKGENIQLERKKIQGKTITANGNAVTETNWSQKVEGEYLSSETNQLIGIAGGRYYYKSNDIPAIPVAYFNNGAKYGLISTNLEGTLGYCTYNSSVDNSEYEYETIEYQGMTWYIRELPFCWANGMGASQNNCYNLGTQTNMKRIVEIGLRKYFNDVTQVMLFNAGNQCSDITGGWTGGFTDGNNPAAGSYSIDSTLACDTWGTWCRYGCYTVNSIDVTNYDKLIFEFEQVSNVGVGYGALGFDVGTGTITNGTNFTCEVDVSSVSGLHRVGFSVANGARAVVKKIYAVQY